MCKGPQDKGGPYRCPGDMGKAVAVAERGHERSSQAALEAEDRLERAQITLESLEEVGPESQMQERMQERADECDGTFESADEIAKEIAGRGHLCAVEETKTYDPDNDHDGERQYDDESYEVKAFSSEEELDEYMDNRYESDGSGDVAYGLDDRTVDYSTGEMETQALFIHQPEGEKQIDQDLTKGHAKQVARAEADVQKAQTAKNSADMKETAAKRKLQEAKKDYEATPRGMGELQREADAYERQGDHEAAEYLRGRLDEATARVNAEEGERKTNAEARGDDRPNYRFMAMQTGEQATPDDNLMGVEEDRAARLVQEDGISGTTRARDLSKDDQGWDHYPHEVTLTRTDEEGNVREVTLPYKMGTAHAGRAPSVADVMHSYSASAADHDNAGGDFDTWREEYGIPDQHDDPDRYRQAKKDFQQGEKTFGRIERFLGSERFEQYKFGESGEYGG